MGAVHVVVSLCFIDRDPSATVLTPYVMARGLEQASQIASVTRLHFEGQRIGSADHHIFV